MDTLHPQAELLLAYVDKQLSPDEVIKAEALIANDPEAASFLKTLGMSDLPFAESFDFLLEDQDSSNENTVLAKSQKNHKTWQWPASMAASLLIGLVIGFSVFSSKQDSSESMASNWITEIANYQLLYVRETVTPAPRLSNDEQLILQEKLSNSLKGGLTIPDLSKHKLNFKRGQLLDINGKPLVQLAYLPDDGLPVALCVLRSDADDSLPKSGESRGLSYIEWSKNGLSYVLIGKTDMKVLESAAISAMNQIAI